MIRLLTLKDCQRKARFAYREPKSLEKLAHPGTGGTGQNFAEKLIEQFPPKNAILITVACDIWPSREKWDEFQNLRDSQSLDSSIEMYPGELFESVTSGEVGYLVKRLSYSLNAFHDLVYRDLDRGKTLWASHDEWIAFKF